MNARGQHRVQNGGSRLCDVKRVNFEKWARAGSSASGAFAIFIKINKQVNSYFILTKRVFLIMSLLRPFSKVPELNTATVLVSNNVTLMPLIVYSSFD